MLSGKKILIYGAGNIGNKLDIHAFDSFNDKIQLNTQKVEKSYKIIKKLDFVLLGV